MIIFLEKEQLEQHIEHIPTRCARIEVSTKGESGGNQLFELIVDLDNNIVAKKEHVEGKHSYIDTDYMKAVEKACLANEKVQAEIRALELPAGATVVVEPWAYATDGMNDMTDRVSMVGHLMPYNDPSAVLTSNSVGFT
jgi:primary-amine oxidase